MTLAAHTRIHGPLPDVPPHQLIEEVERSGLRGRGGADFPTARKLRAVAGRRRVGPVVVNGSETEPASAKDRLLLGRMPHLVLDGAVLAARAVGASEVIVKVGAERAGSLARAGGRDLGARRDDRIAVSVVARTRGLRDRRGERGHPLPEPEVREADIRSAAAVRARLPRAADADPEPRDARPARAGRPLRLGLVSASSARWPIPARRW